MCVFFCVPKISGRQLDDISRKYINSHGMDSHTVSIVTKAGLRCNNIVITYGYTLKHKGTYPKKGLVTPGVAAALHNKYYIVCVCVCVANTESQ